MVPFGCPDRAQQLSHSHSADAGRDCGTANRIAVRRHAQGSWAMHVSCGKKGSDLGRVWIRVRQQAVHVPARHAAIPAHHQGPTANRRITEEGH